MTFFNSIAVLAAALEGSGIYALINRNTGDKYIGSAAVLRKRRNSHWHALRQGIHDNRLLQKAWDVHGADAFSFKILFTCPKPHLIRFEQAALDNMCPHYNMQPTAGNCAGRPISAETREKMRQAKLGRKYSEAHRAAIGASLKGKSKKPFSAEHRAKMRAARLRFLHG